jgi:predicted phosphodiesterase
MKITVISDTHNKQHQITSQLPGGDLLIFAGDMTSMGREYEVQEWMDWFYRLDHYETKVCIAGNHDFFFVRTNRPGKWWLDSLSSIERIG